MKTRNTRNFFLGTIPQLSAEFYKLVIHLIEGNTRIAERDKFAKTMNRIATRGLVHPKNRNVDFGFDFVPPKNYYDEDQQKIMMTLYGYLSNTENFTTEKIRIMYEERFGVLQYGINWRLNGYHRNFPIKDIVIYETDTEKIKVLGFNVYNEYCNKLIKMLLNNEMKTVHFHTNHNYFEGDYFIDVYSVYFKGRDGDSFYLSVEAVNWEHCKNIINPYILNTIVTHVTTQ